MIRTLAALTALFTVVYWTLVFTGVFPIVELVPGHRAWFFSFPIADAWLAAWATVTATKGSRAAALLMGSALVFLGLEAVSYGALTGLLARTDADGLIELGIKVFCLGFGGLACAWGLRGKAPLVLLLLLPLGAQAAPVRLGVATGSGVVQFIERFEEPQVAIHSPWVLALDAELLDAPLGLRARLLHSSARIVGTTRISGTKVDGWLDTTTLFFLAEGRRSWGRWSLEWGGGPGVGVELLLEQPERGGRMQFRVDLAARVGGAVRLGERWHLGLEALGLLTDVPRAVAYVLGGWRGQSGGEDVSLLGLLTLSLEL